MSKSYTPLQSLSRRRLLVVVTCVLVAVSAGSIAYASIPDGLGVIHGCYAKSSGALRVIDSAVGSCKATESQLSWNQQGLEGPGGPAGPQGSAVAYAHVLQDGTIDFARSKNVSIPDAALPAAAQGFYCLRASVPVSNVMATPEYNATDDASVGLVIPTIETQGRDLDITGCDASDAVMLDTWKPRRFRYTPSTGTPVGRSSPRSSLPAGGTSWRADESVPGSATSFERRRPLTRLPASRTAGPAAALSRGKRKGTTKDWPGRDAFAACPLDPLARMRTYDRLDGARGIPVPR